MNIFYKFLTVVLLSCGFTQVSAQILADWHFENPPGANPSTAPTSTSAGITASNAVAVGVTSVTVSHPGAGPAYTEYGFASDGWPTANAVDPGKYYEFTVAPQAGCSITLTGIQFQARIDADTRDENGNTIEGGTGLISARTSADGFGTDLISNPPLLTTQLYSDANFRANTFRSAENSSFLGASHVYTAPFSFRLYWFNIQFYNPSFPSAKPRIDRVRILGQVTCPTAMPVAFNSFTGKAAGNQVQLSWETSWERNADRFDIERSQDAAEFGSIGQVNAAGDATQKQFYGFTDEQALSGVNYYRLRQVDRDGSVRYSKIIAVNTNPDKPAIMVMGNPAEGGRINLQLFNLEVSQLQLFDMQGHPIAFRTSESAKGTVMLEPDNSLRNGMYLIKAANVPAAKILIP